MFENQSKLGVTKRLTKDEVTGKKTWELTGESFFVFLQPLGSKDAPFYDGNFSQSFKFYIDGVSVNIKQRDRITIENDEYEVRSFQSFFFGGTPHLKFFIEKVK